MSKKENGRKGGLANAKNFNKKENQLKALDMYKNEKLTQQEIAEKLGVHQSSVSIYLKEFQPKPIRPRTRKTRS